jgi:hypothetical protein
MAHHMSNDLPVIILLLGATVVPWFLYLFASGKRVPDADGTKPGQPSTAAPDAPAKQGEVPDGSFRAYGLPPVRSLQVRPDGVVPDWRDEPSIPSPAG